MLRSLKDLKGFSLLARDGEIGDVDDFFFDDRDWRLKYFVVDVGSWLRGKKVLISPESMDGMPRWDEEQLPVNLTKDQIEKSPDIDVERPLTREHQETLHNYYGWNAYWTTGFFGTGAPSGTVESGGRVKGGDTNIRSADEVEGYDISAMDGELGDVEDFIVDDEDWSIRYIVLDTGKWLPGRKVLVSPDWITDINFYDKKVKVDATLDQIKNSPEYDPDTLLSREYEERLHNYYGKPVYWKGRKAA